MRNRRNHVDRNGTAGPSERIWTGVTVAHHHHSSALVFEQVRQMRIAVKAMWNRTPEPDQTADFSPEANTYYLHARWMLEWHNKRNDAFIGRSVALLGLIGVTLALLSTGVTSGSTLYKLDGIRASAGIATVLLLVAALLCIRVISARRSNPVDPRLSHRLARVPLRQDVRKRPDASGGRPSPWECSRERKPARLGSDRSRCEGKGVQMGNVGNICGTPRFGFAIRSTRPSRLGRWTQDA